MDQPTRPVPATGGLSQRQINLILFCTLLGTFLGALDQAAIAPALSTIGRELHDFNNLSWVVAAYLVVGTAVTPIYGKLSDIYGRRPMMLVAITIFMIGSVASALANSVLMLVLARSIQGLGAGGLMSIPFAVQGDIIPPRERGKYQPYFSAVWLVSSLLGPVMGGFLADRFHWSLIFWVNIPICVLILLLSSRYLKLLPRHEQRHRIDYAGAVLTIAATSTLLLALSWGGRSYGWISPQILGLACVGIVSGALLMRRLFTAPEPFLPPSILFSHTMRSPLAATFLGSGGFLASVVYMPLYFDMVHGLDAVAAGAALIPMMASTMPGAMLSGLLTMKLKRYTLTAIIGVAAASLSLLPMMFMPDLPLPLVLFFLLLHGAGLGTIFPVTTIMIQNTVPRYQLGTAMAVQTLVRQLGAAMLVTGVGTLLISSLGLPPGASLSAGAGGALHGADTLTAFRYYFLALFVIFSIAVFFLSRMEVQPLRGKEERT